jgi:beta-glucosidase
MKKTIELTLIFLMSSMGAFAEPLEARVDKWVSQMTLDEKLDMIHGDGFNMAPVERLGITPINMSDASMGLRVTPWPHDKGLDPSTAFPASILLSATWNPEMATRYATAVAEEFRARNMHILLGPGINIYRSPLCGRNYEYMGEDPYLTSRMVVPYIQAVKGVGVVPVVKHLVANNSENRRKYSNSVVEERALREIYFPGFKAAVKVAKVPALMNAYNLLNGVYCGEDAWLLKDVLRVEWGFDGFVVSDWSSIWNSDLAANSGVDIEMPGGKQTFVMSPEKMRKMLADGTVSMKEIDGKIKNLIRPCLAAGLYGNDWKKPELNKLDKHAEVALDTARQGIVLLKNEANLLPLTPTNPRKIVVIGPTAMHTPTTGGGSGGVRPENPVSLLDGFTKVFGSIQYLETFDAQKIAAADAVIVCVGLNVGQELKDPRNKKKGPKSIAEEQAGFNKKKKVVIEGEGRDRSFFGLPKNQNELIEKCAKTNPNVVVAYTAGSGIAMPWVDQVKSILWLFYPGQNGAMAAAEIIGGKVNPSGKLPISIEKKIEDSAAYGNFGLSWGDKRPKKKAGVNKYQDVLYKEGIFVGYRHLDQKKIEPQFPFGHGLSFTTFQYGDLKIKNKGQGNYSVSLKVSNVGKRDGFETVQLYVADMKSSVPRPPQELKGFKKILLKAGETKTVELELDSSAFAFWHPTNKKWTVEPGKFELLVGSSSRDVRVRKTLVIQSDRHDKN